LVKIHEKDYIITETADASQGWHPNDERKQVVDESVQTLVHQYTPWEMGHTFHFVIQKQLWRHQDKPESVHGR
jgi:hypothetical protein